VLFKFAVWALERIGTSEFGQDVVHNIEERVERSGVHTALKAAVDTIPHAFQSRIVAGPRPVFEASASGLAAGAPLFTYLMLSFAGYLLNTGVQEQFASYAHEAEKTCAVSNALRNNVEIIVEPTLET